MIAEVKTDPMIGTELSGRWAGARSEHFANDKYRLVWEPDDEAETVTILLVGPKKERQGTIYDRPRPDGSPRQGRE